MLGVRLDNLRSIIIRGMLKSSETPGGVMLTHVPMAPLELDVGCAVGLLLVAEGTGLADALDVGECTPAEGEWEADSARRMTTIPITSASMAPAATAILTFRLAGMRLIVFIPLPRPRLAH